MSDTTSDAGGPRLLDVPADWTLPALGKRVLPPDGQVQVSESTETVTSYDTAAGDLAAAGISLGRGAGTDAVWTLRIDGTSAEFPAAGRGVPAAIRDQLLGVRAGAALRVTGRATITRTSHHVLDTEGVELGVIAEVTVTGTGTDTDAGVRHVEVSGWQGFVDSAVARLVKADAIEQAPHTTAGVHALEGISAGTVGAALQRYLGEQRRAVLQADLDLRRAAADDDTEPTVHAFRVAIRRTRSALRVVDVADPARREELDGELKWLSGVLGEVRDLHVLREHLAASIIAAADREDVDLDPARAALQSRLDAEERGAQDALAAALAGRRYLSLLRLLRDWTAEPPFGEVAAKPEKTLSRYVRAAAKDLDRRLAKAGGSARRLHGARKAAKRARYVASFAGDAAGAHGTAIEKRAKTLQTSLGDHQDCVLAADFVHRTARDAVDGAAAFGCGVLWSLEQQRAADALRDASEAQRKLRKAGKKPGKKSGKRSDKKKSGK